MVFLVLAVPALLLHGYVWWRVVRDTTAPGAARVAGTVALAALALCLAATLALSRVVDPAGWRWLFWIGFVWAALLLYLVLLLLLAEPVRAMAKRRGVGRRVFLSRVIAGTAGALAAGAVGYGMGVALGGPDVRRARVALPGLRPEFDGFRIALVTDLHAGGVRTRDDVERVVRLVNAEHVDLVALVGDLADGSVAHLGGDLAPLGRLRSREGTFFTTGNHEYLGEYRAWEDYLRGLGIRVLRNERVTLRRGAGTLDLAGVNDRTGENDADPPDYPRALAGAHHPVVLLAHQPVQVEQAARYHADLQLSGHTHGGQAFPFHLAVLAAQPSLAGMSTVDGTRLFVSRGAGFWGPPVRLGAPPDIAVLTLARGPE